MTYSVKEIKAFKDNYIWAIIKNNDLVLVDPGDANAVLDFINKNKLILNAILVTHHHSDHTGGIKKLKELYKEIPVFGPKNETIPCITHKLSQNNEVVIDKLDLKLKVMDVPGHTLGHIAYYNDELIFVGDTLFAGGCGRIFEGNPQMLFESLNKIKQLPDEILVYCAHEYTAHNLKFASTVEKNNKILSDRLNNVIKFRELGKATIPTKLEIEKLTNPFLRCRSDEIVKFSEELLNKNNISELEVFTVLRELKDNF